jgi:uncharacterized membrane protein YgdD (TMEM256/DUF423 family)
MAFQRPVLSKQLTIVNKGALMHFWRSTPVTVSRYIFACGALLALLAVMLGAFGAHALKSSLDSYALSIFETAARYQMTHAIALLIVGVTGMIGVLEQRWLNWAALAFGAGIIFFCGSLYLLAFSGVKWLGAITPLGGLMLMSGWLLLSIAAFKKTRD